jgi:DNA-directed RNA polymerase
MILHDEKGARATNLSSDPQPQDIYTQVLEDLIKEITPTAEPRILEVLDRDLVKRPVMTDAYSVTRRGIEDQLIAHCRKFSGKYNLNRKDCCYIAHHLINSINNVIVSSRRVKDFLKEITKVFNEEEKPLIWTVPSGFTVHQLYPKTESEVVNTYFEKKKLNITYFRETARINKYKQLLAVSPNFIHSYDASHLVATVNNASRLDGIEDIFTVHDSYSTHATNMTKLNYRLRKELVDLYKECPLQRLLEECRTRTQKILPDVPKKGNFDINEVMLSEISFS